METIIKQPEDAIQGTKKYIIDTACRLFSEFSYLGVSMNDIAKKSGKVISGTITVRKVISGIGVEKIFPLRSPMLKKIKILKRGKLRRAKLYYLRTAKGKKGKLKNRNLSEAIVYQANKEEPVKIKTEAKIKEVSEEQQKETKKEPEAKEKQEGQKEDNTVTKKPDEGK